MHRSDGSGSHWVDRDRRGERLFPHEFVYDMVHDGSIQPYYQIDPKDSWVVAAAETNLPLWVPGWEDSTLGNMYAAHCISGDVKNVHTVRTGIEYMIALAEWYTKIADSHSIGFFQIGGGIAGDFPICVVPMLHQDLSRPGVPVWGYFCQISDSTTSFGSYSGAVPNKKITWGNWLSIRRSTSSNPMHRLSPRSSSLTSWGGDEISEAFVSAGVSGRATDGFTYVAHHPVASGVEEGVESFR